METIIKRLDFASHWAKYGIGSRDRCALRNCSGAKSLWRRVWSRRHAILFNGSLYCHPQCLETAVRHELLQVQNQAPHLPPANRMPLGLLMVARGKLTYDQVSAALDAQRKSGKGNIGEWFEKLGFVTEREVASALALQWGCPVSSSLEFSGISRKLPLALLESFLMWPLHYVSATDTLYIAFGKPLDHAALYAIEKMLGCRVQPCVAPGKVIASRIERLGQESRTGEIEFRSMHDAAEMVRITQSYISRLDVNEIRMSHVGNFIWLLLKNLQMTTHLLFQLRGESRPTSEVAELHSLDSGVIAPNEAHLWQKETPFGLPTAAP